jgi:protein-disulfide isomerase
MRLAAFAGALAALALLAAPAASQAQRARPRVAARDWSQLAVRTPEGGVRIGNPAAPVHLVEYGSITCPHCAAFQAEGSAALRTTYVRSGRVSWEYRPFLIFPTDPGVFVLLNCLPVQGFFPAVDQLYATQRSWVDRIVNMPAAQQQQINGMAPPLKAAALVRAAGLDTFFRAHGLTSARLAQCLNNHAGFDAVVGTTRRGGNEGVQGTPTFFVNGRDQHVVDWASLEVGLRQALGS